MLGRGFNPCAISAKPGVSSFSLTFLFGQGSNPCPIQRAVEKTPVGSQKNRQSKLLHSKTHFFNNPFSLTFKDVKYR